MPSVVLIVTLDKNNQPVSLGSGFCVGNELIATNLHVTEGAASGYVKLVGQRAKHGISGFMAVDPAADLAILKVSGLRPPTLSLGDSSAIAIGDEVYVVGNPQGLEGTFSSGIVSSIRQVGSDSIFQITAPISPGSSGGPVLDRQGRVIGVAVATFRGGQNLNFAIPASYLKSLLERGSVAAVKPFSEGSVMARGNSLLSGLGDRSTEGVAGGKFLWGSSNPYDYSFSFTLENRLREPVKDVYVLVIFYGTDGRPVDTSIIQYRDVVPPGLARRVSGCYECRVDASVRELTTPRTGYLGIDFELVPATKLEIRVLDFRIVD